MESLQQIVVGWQYAALVLDRNHIYIRRILRCVSPVRMSGGKGDLERTFRNQQYCGVFAYIICFVGIV